MKKLIIICALLNSGCAIQTGIRLKKAERCQIQRVKMYWVDGTESIMILNSCRYGRNFELDDWQK
jgi:hypothetical protein